MHNQVFHWISPNHPIWGPELSSCLTSMIPAWECWGVGIECSIIAAQLNQTTVAALHWWVPSYRCRHQQHLCDFMMYQQRCPFPAGCLHSAWQVQRPFENNKDGRCSMLVVKVFYLHFRWPQINLLEANKAEWYGGEQSTVGSYCWWKKSCTSL